MRGIIPYPAGALNPRPRPGPPRAVTHDSRETGQLLDDRWPDSRETGQLLDDRWPASRGTGHQQRGLSR
ncbi:MAG TPA: hypothetical protein VFL94_07850 [Actinomycetales bacterium]|nr:hypothetical protein [Actinomycetales bacterium]